MGGSNTGRLAIDVTSLAACYAACRWRDAGLDADRGARDGSVLGNGENAGDEGKDNGGVLHVD